MLIVCQISGAVDGEGVRGADAVCEEAAGGDNVRHTNTVYSSRKGKKKPTDKAG